VVPELVLALALVLVVVLSAPAAAKLMLTPCSSGMARLAFRFLATVSAQLYAAVSFETACK
jgi:hypothetical protein